MQSTSPDILIIGGGVAGMAAALALKTRDLKIHLVESRDKLGGHGAAWACMATDTCQNCGACLALEMADQTLHQSNVTLHLSSRVTHLETAPGDVRARLDTGEEIRAGHLINATGFTPFDPARLPALGHGNSPRILTTAQLNTALNTNGLDPLLKDIPHPRIAFIQCVGSRNRKLERDFCSQVCCKISMRHADKLLFRHPQSRISLFYMDLQVLGKETRSQLAALGSRVELIQGIPGEILEMEGHPTLVSQNPDPETRTAQPRVQRQFDLVILSVGMAPAESQSDLATLLNQPRNPWGFFTRYPDKSAQGHDNIQSIGCAAAPMDIPSSIRDGRLAAARIISPEFTEQPRRLAVLGSGPQAQAMAEAAQNRGHQVFHFGSPGDPAPHLEQITAIQGHLGQFTIHHQDGNHRHSLDCHALIAAPAPRETPPGALASPPGDTGEAAPIIKPRNLFTTARRPIDRTPDRTLILMDYDHPAPKQATALALEYARSLVQSGRQCAVAMRHMGVHGMDGQRRYDQARKEGVLFLRYTAHTDIALAPTPNGIALTLQDPTLGGAPLESNWDNLVMPPLLEPGPGFADLARHLDNQRDGEGFLQSPNVRHRLIQSPRRGVFYVGNGHDDIGQADLDLEIQAILGELALTVPSQAPDQSGKDSALPRVAPDRCAQCLTCLRICPHSAITLDPVENRPVIHGDACFNCRLCQVNCPACAIDAPPLDRPEPGEKKTTVILACQRSAALAADAVKLPDHIRLIPLPCACRISPSLILEELTAGAQQVMVAGCHHGNCQSLQGSRTAQDLVGQMTRLPGIQPGQILWEPVAANEPHRFQDLTRPQPPEKGDEQP